MPDSKGCARERVEGAGTGTEQISVGWSRYSGGSTAESCIESSTSVGWSRYSSGSTVESCIESSTSVGWSGYSSCSTAKSCIESSTNVVGQVQ